MSDEAKSKNAKVIQRETTEVRQLTGVTEQC